MNGLCSLLQYNPGSLSNQNKITQTMNDDTPVALFDDTRKDGKSGRQTRVSIREDINIGTLYPGLIDGSVDRFFHILAVKINRGLHIGKRSAREKVGKWTLKKTKNKITGNLGHPTV